MKIKEHSTREVMAIMKANGYEIIRRPKSSHAVFSNGKNVVSIPVQNKMVNRVLFARLVKENGLILS